MRVFQGRHVVFSALFCIFSQIALASPYTTKVTGDVSEIKDLSKSLHDGVVRRASPMQSQNLMRLSFHGTGIGRANVVLNRITYKNWDAFITGPLGEALDSKDVILVSGYLKDANNKKLPVGGSLYNSKGHPTLHLIISGKENTKRTAYVRVRLDEEATTLPARISSIPVGISSRTCGSKDHSLSLFGANIVTAKGTASGTATIGTDADPEYYAAYGADTNAHIATIISSASAIYAAQMGIYLSVGTQHAFSSTSGNPYTATDSGDLLTQFQTYTLSNHHLGSATAYHLFSGKQFDGDVIGLAYLKTICSVPSYTFGTTQKYHPSSDAHIFAHELGHNFGANHDTTDSNSIMAPVVRIPGSTYFSAASISEIQSALQSADTCLDQSGGGGSGGGTSPSDPSDPSYVPTTRVGVKLSSSGLLTLSLAVDSLKDGCTLHLYSSSSSSSRGTEIYAFTPTSTLEKYRISNLKHVRSGERKSYIYFRTANECSVGTSQSASKGVNLNVITSRSSTATVSRTIAALKRLFASL